METSTHLSSHEINGLVQYEAGNTEFISLTNDQLQAIREHLKQCAQCREEYEISKSAYKEINETLSPSASNKNKVYYVAAAIALIAACVFVFWGIGNNTKDAELAAAPVDKEIPKQEDSVHVLEEQTTVTANKETMEEEEPIPNHQQLAVNFEPVAALDQLLNNPMRSNVVKVTKPSNGDKLNDDIQFDWDIRGSVPLEIRIVDNREELVFSKSGLTYGQLIIDGNFKPGIYYWTLETDEEIVYNGMFYYRYIK